ncbi:MAG TPA: diphthine--ammonia ligase [Paludibacter sp.]|nr:diphthine--ammonia ligase [Paludibacter sp.]
MKNVLCSWSGGKDCCFALLEAKKLGYNPVLLLNMMDDDGKTSRSHGLPVEILKKQAKAMNMELMTIPTSRENYEENFINALNKAKLDYNIEGVVYGDIDLVAHREWQERVCKIVGLEPILPLWERKRTTLAKEMVEAGIESVIVACNNVMGKSFLGKIYNLEMIDQLIEMNVCSCGEDGEFHSLVVNSPLHQYKVQIPDFATSFRNDFHFIDWKTN